MAARDAHFPTTSWTLVGLAAGKRDDQQALDQLLRLYLEPMRQHVQRRWRLDLNACDDLVQEFVTKRVLERDLLASADSQRGAFRNLLRKSLDNFVKGDLRTQSAQKRRHEQTLSLQEHEASTNEEESFGTCWAVEVMKQTLARMEADLRAKDQLETWEVFTARLVDPILHRQPACDYATLVARFQFSSPSQAANALVTAKRAFARTLRQVIADYTMDNHERDVELDTIKQFIASSK